MEFRLRSLCFVQFFCKTSHYQAVKKMESVGIRKNKVNKPLGFCMILYVWL